MPVPVAENAPTHDDLGHVEGGHLAGAMGDRRAGALSEPPDLVPRLPNLRPVDLNDARGHL